MIVELSKIVRQVKHAIEANRALFVGEPVPRRDLSGLWYRKPF